MSRRHRADAIPSRDTRDAKPSQSFLTEIPAGFSWFEESIPGNPCESKVKGVTSCYPSISINATITSFYPPSWKAVTSRFMTRRMSSQPLDSGFCTNTSHMHPQNHKYWRSAYADTYADRSCTKPYADICWHMLTHMLTGAVRRPSLSYSPPLSHSYVSMLLFLAIFLADSTESQRDSKC